MSFAGCSEAYDDKWILDKFEEMEKEHSDMQAQIDAQQTLLNALANNLSIIAITPTTEGYLVTFSDGSTLTVKHGDKGDKGDTGAQGEKGEDGDSFFAEVVVGEDCVTFTLADGTMVVIPLSGGESGDGDNADGALNKIYYTTTDGKKLFPYNSGGAAFGAILISNTYENGQGVLVFDDTITSIGSSAFSGCSSLASVTIPDSVTLIGSSAFSKCSSLTSITIPDSVTSIGSSAFEGCSSLSSITIPDSVTSIGSSAFCGCSSLTSITIPEGVTEIRAEAFSKCSSLASINIPNGVTLIGGSAFSKCSSLTSITIPEGVTEIGSEAFYKCSGLTSITIPDSVTSIGYYAFYGCSSLAEVYCKPTTPPAGGDNMFYNNASGRKIYVPTDSVEAYKTAEGWSEYADAIVGYDFNE